jgi:hypothetical protein
MGNRQKSWKAKRKWLALGGVPEANPSYYLRKRPKGPDICQ